jgi:cytidylate kinase
VVPLARSVDAWNAYIDCQSRCGDDAKKRGKRAGQPFVTISRQVGAGGITVGEKLISFLNKHDKAATCPWTIFDKNLVAAVLKDHHLPKRYAEFMPEQNVSEVRDMVEELIGLHPAEFSLAQKTSETILHLAHLGRVVLVGRGGNVITGKLKGGFHVRLVGSLKQRIQHASEYYKIDAQQAQKFIEDEDNGRAAYIKRHFNENVDDPTLYHLVINTDLVRYDEAAELISCEVLKVSAPTT